MPMRPLFAGPSNGASEMPPSPNDSSVGRSLSVSLWSDSSASLIVGSFATTSELWICSVSSGVGGTSSSGGGSAAWPAWIAVGADGGGGGASLWNSEEITNRSTWTAIEIIHHGLVLSASYSCSLKSVPSSTLKVCSTRCVLAIGLCSSGPDRGDRGSTCEPDEIGVPTK